MTGKYLITTDAWFIAPNGKNYRAVWGEVEILSDSFLNIKTNNKSTNWFAKIGSEKRHVIVAGCQIHYAIKCEEKPMMSAALDYSTNDKGCKEYFRPSQIWNAQSDTKDNDDESN